MDRLILPDSWRIAQIKGSDWTELYMASWIARTVFCSSYHQPIWKHKFAHHPLICDTSPSSLSPNPMLCLASFMRFIAFQGDFTYLVMIPNSKYLSNGIVFPWKSRYEKSVVWKVSAYPNSKTQGSVKILDSGKEWSLLIFPLFLECRLRRVIINSISRRTLWKVVNWEIENSQCH